MVAELNNRPVSQIVDPSTSNFRIDPLKKRNDKLTVKARKTSAVVVSFDVAQADKTNYDVYRLILQKPEGGDVSGKQKVTLLLPQDNSRPVRKTVCPQ